MGYNERETHYQGDIMPSFDETKAAFDTIYGGNLESSLNAANAFVTPRPISRTERALTTKLPRTALLTAATSYALLAGRINYR
jgi:hypothetical protein